MNRYQIYFGEFAFKKELILEDANRYILFKY
ncbi:hypothetical protein IMSAGC011_01822 [Lachnospiraceae bacterium]|nr:hypothetical protein IMSAGC011_01822 [Lachnospiraceae bacterium]